MKTVRLLLVNPRTPPSFWGLEHSLEIARIKASNAPLGLITVAALTPDRWEVALVDENVEPLDLDAGCDVVGIGAMNNQAERAFEIADAFRRRGRTVVIGGPLAFSNPESCTLHCDSLVVGEAERTWPALCSDYEAGACAPRYRETEPVDLATSPVPRYDLLASSAYASIPLQTSRGCPHRCEFCDIIEMFGRRVRTKPVDNVVAEVEAIRVHGGTDSIFITDDNFNGNVKYTRSLLRALIDLRSSTQYKPLLFTQASLDLAEQDEMLRLMVQAGFSRLFLGVETPRQSSLREAGKRQNLRGDLLARIHKLQHAGLVTWAGMIVGFDSDDPDVFAEQAEFLDEAGIAVAMVGMLNALPHTPLHRRLRSEGRLVGADLGNNCASTNIVPSGMSRAEMFRGYGELLTHLYTQENYARRLMSNIYRMGPPLPGVISTRLPSRADLADLMRAIVNFTFSRRADYRRHFVPNLLRVCVRRFARAVEACVHLGVWQHFDRYVPFVVEALEDNMRAELAATHALPAACMSAAAGNSLPAEAAPV